MIVNRRLQNQALKSVMTALQPNGDGRGSADDSRELGGVICSEDVHSMREYFCRLYGIVNDDVKTPKSAKNGRRSKRGLEKGSVEVTQYKFPWNSTLSSSSWQHGVDPPEDAVVTMCGHVFCYQCVSEYLRGDDNLCPARECRELLGSDVVFSRATLRSCISDELDSSAPSSSGVTEKSVIVQSDYSSSKIRAALGILQSHCKLRNSSLELSSEACNGISFTSEVGYTKNCYSDSNAAPDTTVYSNSETEGPVKAIVFSQWTGMLDLLEISLNQYNIEFRRLDGTMSLASRDKAVKDFNCDPEIHYKRKLVVQILGIGAVIPIHTWEVTVILMSLKAGNLGLNMVAASHVILLDLWWNPTTEDQAIDRAHRIGQTRPVTVSRITIKDTVEDRILSLQEEKRKMVASAFGEDQMGGSATRLTVEDLRYLFMV
ncbi:hypothetical protein HHK36_014510 [Tetracentron sinense]|uniref:Helicase C-terminal domain-containing protein n=1 Tax=Tetracentron sinense TaxID=13715 RepID=A0A834Z3J3_TETSI|nr:hypothetical protein HHK36_014510 [Tetracentron sinense]